MNATSAMVEMLMQYGERFVGNHPADTSEDWIGHGFDADSASPWCEIGVWDAGTASALRDYGISPADAVRTAESLTDGLDDPSETYTDGDPIYAVCNGDLTVDTIINAAAEKSPPPAHRLSWLFPPVVVNAGRRRHHPKSAQ